MGELSKEERLQLIAACEKGIAGKQTEREELRRQMCSCGNPHGEVCDDFERTDARLEREALCHRIEKVGEDIARISAVATLLRSNWDGTCVDCQEQSVLGRIRLGHFTRRCCACKTAAEKKGHHYKKATLRLNLA